MADESNGSGSAGVVAIVAIFVLVILGALFVFRGRLLGSEAPKKIDINVSTPAK